ncbi:MAG: hypothetical protein J1E38_03590 [Paramuribaculum sp.]|nr:hypothetical protein [Paramuribaculum sp.]
MKQNLIAGITFTAAAMMLSSCATLFTKSKQDVTFQGQPGTMIVDPKKNTYVAQIGENGFATAKLKKQLSAKKLEAQHEGYQTKEIQVPVRFTKTSLWNILFGGVPGFAIDVATGKIMHYKNDVVNATLTPIAGYREEEVITPVVEEQRVTRDNPGVTDMEKAVVRWYFDSDPRGARISYRVISNVPNEVKNTNETYLTTTPLEETKPFNIPGLTYNNANDVTIEIKVSKRGFEDQVKRYNVRQALDQQEISGFFELVPKK